MPLKLSAADRDDLVARYLAGESENSVAKRFDIGRPTARRMLLLAGVQPRNQSDSETMKWSRMGKSARRKQVAAAHAAVLGTKIDTAGLLARSAMRQQIGRMNGGERFLHDLLAERGLPTIPQQAIGPYNCDLGASPVAVEILGGHWHCAEPRKGKILKRTRYIVDSGWHVLMIEVDHRFPITPTQADYVVAYVQARRSNPSTVCEYRVIRGAGEFVTCGSADDDEISIEPAFTARRNPANGRYETVPR